MMKRHLSMALVVVLFSLSQIAVQAAPSQLTAKWLKVLSNKDYFPAVEKLFAQANDQIWVMMYSARYYTEKPQYARHYTHGEGQPYSNTNLLLEDLVAACRRGVKVMVILDSSDWNKENTRKNRLFAQLLKKGGVKVLFDDPQVTTHDKLILVDDDFTVVGSTNWTYYALEENNETSVLIKSKGVNKAYRKYFLQVKKGSHPF